VALDSAAGTQIWLIGGTSESAQLAIALLEQKIPYLVTVTTESARRLYPPSANVQVGKMSPEQMSAFIQAQRIAGILDASHPFACEISQQAIALQTVPYLRYERAAVQPQVLESAQAKVTVVDSIEALLASPRLHHQRVLLTLGCRDLYRFSTLRQTTQLFARILPSIEAIAQARAAGFTPDEIVALKPPISAALEKALWQQWSISQVVAKSSGHPGGETVKRQVAAELGVELILLRRPPVNYPQQTSSEHEAIKFCRQTIEAL